MFEIAKTASGYASTPTTPGQLRAQTNSSGAAPTGSFRPAGLIADGAGNLFGTTEGGGANGARRTVFEIAKTASGYASTPTTLVSFCAHTNGSDLPLATSRAGLIADANGDLFGTTSLGGANGRRHGVRDRQDRQRLRQHPDHLLASAADNILGFAPMATPRSPA